MKTTKSHHRKRGFISYVLVLSTGAILTFMMLYAYRRAMIGNKVQANVQLRLDYSEKEETILRSIVAIVPNRAIRAMKSGSSATTAASNPLRWQDIFTESIALANAGTSISSGLASKLNVTNVKNGNSGDSALGDPTKIFKAAKVSSTVAAGTGFVTSGTVTDASTLVPDPGYPPLLRTSNTVITSASTGDSVFPIISDAKRAVGLAAGALPNFNQLKYPQINFGYAKPGDNFVAKRNWWAFSMDVAGNDAAKTALARPSRNMVLSIYEIPSQLAISASSFMTLGKFGDTNDNWTNVTINGGVFAGNVDIQGSTAMTAIAARRGMTFSSGATIGGQSAANMNFTPGTREAFQMTPNAFFPVSLASESGRAAFVPINRGADFFDRFTDANKNTETNTISPTSWNDYSVGAKQCAMWLDITKKGTDSAPSELRFSYLLANGTRRTDTLPIIPKGVSTTLGSGFVEMGTESTSNTYTFTTPTDVAYGYPGGYSFIVGFTGTLRFDNATFGDPYYGRAKKGYARKVGGVNGTGYTLPFKSRILTNGKFCISLLPANLATYLASIGAAGPAINDSIAINVDYSNIGTGFPVKPSATPCSSSAVGDYGVVLDECSDLTAYTKGFSLVTNLGLYFADDFNIVPYSTAPPTGYTPPVAGYFPPCSLFAPEKRYGADTDPYSISLTGQIGSLVSGEKVNAGDTTEVVSPLDSKSAGGSSFAGSRIKVNLSPITHPAELPPVTMMNWLILLEERRKEYY